MTRITLAIGIVFLLFGAALGEELHAVIRLAAAEYGVDPKLIRSVVIAESGGRAWAVSPKGAQGVMQLMPDTARRFGVRNPFDIAENIRGGAEYLRWLLDRFRGDIALALAGYNAGEGAVDRWGGIPPYTETRAYVRKVLSLYRGTGQVREFKARFVSRLKPIGGAGVSGPFSPVEFARMLGVRVEEVRMIRGRPTVTAYPPPKW